MTRFVVRDHQKPGRNLFVPQTSKTKKPTETRIFSVTLLPELTQRQRIHFGLYRTFGKYPLRVE